MSGVLQSSDASAAGRPQRFYRATYQMMEAAFRPAWTGEMPDWMEPFRRTIDAAKKYVVSSTLERVDYARPMV